MTRLVGREVAVSLDFEGAPCRVAGRAAEPLMRWLVEQDWWAQLVTREYWRVLLDGELLAELYRDGSSGVWVLERVYD